MDREQHVCLVCGFNMIGFHPSNCPFCKRRFDAGPLFGGY